MSRFGQNRRLSLCCLLILTAYGCKGVPNPTSGNDGGNNNNNGGNGGNANLASTYTFLGNWSGVYKPTDPNTEQHQTEASANFQATDNSSGTFRIDLPQINSTPFAAGTYQIFNQSSLFLHIAQSTISALGEPSTTTEITYTLLGNSLEMKSDRLNLKFLRSGQAPGTPGAAPAPSTQQGGTQATDPVYGLWRCNDRLGHLWQAHIHDTSLFTIQVSDSRGERGTIWLQGSLSITRAPGRPDVSMRVEHTDIGKYNGMQLTGVMLPSGQLRLTRVGPPDEDMTCDHG